MRREETYQQRFSVDFEYPVVFTHDVFQGSNPILAEKLVQKDLDRIHRAVVFVDSGVMAAHPNLQKDIPAYFATHSRLELAAPPRVVTGGEEIKNEYRLVMEIVDTILEYRLCRHSPVIAIGGGAVLDAVGFAASIIHRGLRTVRLPTTVLAQNDAGIGVKTGMNLHGVKNLVGTYHPPFAVINDFSFLFTLSDTHWRAGIAEAFKVAIIKDSTFFQNLCSNGETLRMRDATAMEDLIVHCAELHLDHIKTGGDAFEYGRARPLDFGHWSGHKLEAMSGFTLGHGSAIAIGIALDSYYAFRQGWISDNDFEAIYRGLADSGLELWSPFLDRRLGDGTPEVLQGLADFREHLGGELQITFPDGIGHRIEVSSVDTVVMTEGITVLRERWENSNACTPKS